MAKKKLKDFFSILSEGKDMSKDLEKIRLEQMELTKKRLKEFKLSSE